MTPENELLAEIELAILHQGRYQTGTVWKPPVVHERRQFHWALKGWPLPHPQNHAGLRPHLHHGYQLGAVKPLRIQAK